MLYWLLSPLSDEFQIFNLLNYTTFRAGAALMTALIISMIIGAPFIKWLRMTQNATQPIREDGPEGHLLAKKGTPTMGGIIILISLALSTLLWANISNLYIWIVLIVTISFGVIGFVDDFMKVTKSKSGGLNGRIRLLLEFLIAFIAVYITTLYAPVAADQAINEAQIRGFQINLPPDSFETSLSLPFIKDVLINLTLFGFILFGGLVVVGSANSVNLTDGLDGLAIVPVIIAAGTFAAIAYICGTPRFANYLLLIYTPGTSELAVLLSALIGSGLGFLWYNALPAKIFMGDTGSLALGGALGMSAVCAKHEIVLVIVGGLFVVEAISVIVQVISFKLTGKRIFRMAPIHHHFEKLGWHESTIVIRFWIISFVLALIGLATLKLR